MSEAKGNQRKKQIKGRSHPQIKPGAEFEMGALRRGAISVFILFHLIVITCVAVPLRLLSIEEYQRACHALHEMEWAFSNMGHVRSRS